MPRIRIKHAVSISLPAFTLIESLMTLSVIASLVLITSGQVQSVFQSVQEQLFVHQFETFYLDSQRYAASQRTENVLTLSNEHIQSALGQIEIPDFMTYTGPDQLTLDQSGGNSSLAKLSFQTEEHQYTYQLYLGSGRYKKDSKSLHFP
ncbi:competence type IV pilus minor pilin ComGD [Streptococcus caprae]